MAKIEPKIFDELKIALMTFGIKYFVNEELNRSKLSEDLRNYNEELLSRLFEVEFIKNHYIKEVAGQKLFQIEQLEEAVLYSDYWDTSYTKYENRIGLTSSGNFLSDNEDVVLNFPFKDGVLTAGMTKEDKEDGYQDAFLNETIEKNEIDTLFDDKIFVNVKRYGNSDLGSDNMIVPFDKERENLIIKGNNLLALHTLKEKYAGQVKLIYIDPPYNTGEDGFQYNDKFSRSAWLTFMKNRIQVAKELLADDGVLLIQISFHEYPYLRTLLDSPEILGEENHIFDMNVLVRHPERALTADKLFNDVVEYTLIYQKSASFVMPKIEVLKTSDKYKYDVEVAGPAHEVRIMGNKTVEIYLPEQVNVVKKAGHIEGLHRETIRGSIREKNSSGRFYVANLEELRDEFPPLTFFKVEGMGDDSLGYRWFELPKENIKNGAYYQGMPQSSNITLKPYPNFIDFVKEYNSANHEGVYSFRNGKKPEAFIKYYLDMFTEENDLVMDFFMGSATTQAVAMKMHRRFIGIEQMDYIKTVSVPRLEKVIEGEQSGISKDVNWHGGGSFLYAELMPKNMTYLQKIIHTKELLELKSIWEHMINGINGSSKVDINFRADLDKLNWNEGFDENKRLLVKILDKNGLYYNYSEIDDETVRESISDEDYQFNKVFYERRE